MTSDGTSPAGCIKLIQTRVDTGIVSAAWEYVKLRGRHLETSMATLPLPMRSFSDATVAHSLPSELARRSVRSIMWPCRLWMARTCVKSSAVCTLRLLCCDLKVQLVLDRMQQQSSVMMAHEPGVIMLQTVL